MQSLDNAISFKARRRGASTSITLRKCRLKSMTSAAPTVWPHWLVPAPRASTGTFSSRAMSIAVATSASQRGTNTPTGMIW